MNKTMKHEIKIYINDTVINIGDYQDITYENAKSSTEVSLLVEAGNGGHIGDIKFIRSYGAVPCKCKDYKLVIGYNTNGKIESISISRNAFKRMDIDDDVVIDKLLVEDHLGDTRQKLFKRVLILYSLIILYGLKLKGGIKHGIHKRINRV